MDIAPNINLNKEEWDYTKQASFYCYRPNYAKEAIDELCRHVGAKKEDYLIADIGAGTGNLTLMLLERGYRCLAIEPNTAMRNLGMERTQAMDVKWIAGTGENTGLKDASVELFAMGSSFNTTEQSDTLKEAQRVLKPGGYFSCMWNHRDIANDPVQKRVDEIIRFHVPNYSYGSRRKDPSDVIRASGYFKNINYTERAQKVSRTVEEYIGAWSSVKNSYWDVSTSEGQTLYNKIMSDMRREFEQISNINMIYTTRIWTAQKNDNI